MNPSLSHCRGRGTPGRGVDQGNHAHARGAGCSRGCGRGLTSSSATEPTTESGATPPPVPPKRKLFNLLTYKLHSLSDYVRAVRWFGTTDSYSTQPVSILSIPPLIPAGIDRNPTRIDIIPPYLGYILHFYSRHMFWLRGIDQNRIIFKKWHGGGG